MLLQMLSGKEYDALQIHRFRLSGENHQWMYDSYSIGKKLIGVGFKSIEVRNAAESYIPCCSVFNLDTKPDGSIYKPYFLFMEAIKA